MQKSRKLFTWEGNRENEGIEEKDRGKMGKMKNVGYLFELRM